MDNLLVVLTRIERDLRDRRDAVDSLSEYIEAMQTLGIKVGEEQQTVRMLEEEISTLSTRRSMLTRVVRRATRRRIELSRPCQALRDSLKPIDSSHLP